MVANKDTCLVLEVVTPISRKYWFVICPVKKHSFVSDISNITYLGACFFFTEYHFRNSCQYVCLGLQDKSKIKFERECESDQEEEVMLRRPQTRRRSSTSWNSLVHHWLITMSVAQGLYRIFFLYDNAVCVYVWCLCNVFYTVLFSCADGSFKM